MKKKLWLLAGGIAMMGGGGISWLLRDDFNDTLDAGSVNDTSATPGPGTRVVTDTNSKLSVGSGVVTYATGGVGDGDPGLWYGSIARAAGRIAIAQITPTTNISAGFDSNQAGAGYDVVRFTTSSTLTVRIAGTALTVGAFSAATSYQIAVIQRATGAMYWIKGGAFTDWTLIYISPTGTTTPLYPMVSAVSTTGVGTSSQIRVPTNRWLPTPSLSDGFGQLPTDSYAGSIPNTTAFTHEADFISEFTNTTLPSVDESSLRFRQLDGSNFMFISIDSDGDLSLTKKVAGGNTVLQDATGILVGGEKIRLTANGATVEAYYNGQLAWTETGATNFLTNTDSSAQSLDNGAVWSDIAFYPYSLTSDGQGHREGITDSIASPSAGNTFVHPANFRLDFDVTTIPSAANVQVDIHKIDDDNTYQIAIDATSNDIRLVEIVSGSGTNKIYSAGAVSANDRITAISESGVISLYVNGERIDSYTMAFYQAVTGGEVQSLGTGGAIANLVTAPLSSTGLGSGGNGIAWIDSGNWRMDGAGAYCEPILGAELLDNGDMESGDPPDDWTAYSTPTTREANTTSPIGGVQDLHIVGDSALKGARQINQWTAVLGQWYQAKASGRAVSGTYVIAVGGGGFDWEVLRTSSTSNTSVVSTRRDVDGDWDTIWISTYAAAGEFYADDISVRVIDLPSTLRIFDAGTPRLLLKANITTATRKQCGFVLQLDDRDDPQNMILVFLNGTSTVDVVKRLGGTYTTVSSTAITYSAGAELLVSLGTSGEVRTFYNNALVKADTVSDAGIVSNTLHGTFATNESSRIADFVAYHKTHANYDAVLNLYSA